MTACFKRAREVGGAVKLVLRGKSYSLFTITQLDRVFEIFDDVDAAVTELRAAYGVEVSGVVGDSSNADFLVVTLFGGILGGVFGDRVQADSRRAEDQVWTFGRVLALVEDVAAVGQLEGRLGILLDQQDGDAASGDLADLFEDRLDQDRRDAEEEDDQRIDQAQRQRRKKNRDEPVNKVVTAKVGQDLLPVHAMQGHRWY